MIKLKTETANIKNIAKKTLKTKWSLTDHQYLNISSSCEFCFHASWDCRKCLCPKLICSVKGKKGFVNFLKEKYGDNLTISEFSRKSEFDLMIKSLNELSIAGTLSRSTIDQFTSLFQ